MEYGLYIAAALGAAGLYLALPHERSLAKAGALVGLAALAGLLVWLSATLGGEGPGWYYYAFTFISAACAVRVISHPRPVYSALYFVLVVLSSAGLLIVLQAEFMAFAMTIIYGGAILVTYMFVIMLATMPQSEDRPETAPVYDRAAREPLLAAAMGFALLGVLSNVMFGPLLSDPSAEPIPRQSATQAWTKMRSEAAEVGQKIQITDAVDRRRLERQLRGRDENPIGPNEYVHALDLKRGRVEVRQGPSFEKSTGSRGRWVPIDRRVLEEFIGNIDFVGLNLFKGHTLGIELAGVVLLLSMVGAIVIARRRLPEGSMPADH